MAFFRHFLRLALFSIFLQFLAAASCASAKPSSPRVPSSRPLRAPRREEAPVRERARVSKRALCMVASLPVECGDCVERFCGVRAGLVVPASW